MGLKHHTIIFVPHTRAKFRKWRVSSTQLRVAVALAVVTIVGVSLVFWQAATSTVGQEQVEQLRAENAELRELTTAFEESLRTLQGQLTEFEDRTDALAIVAGLDNMLSSVPAYPTGEAGAGGDFSVPPSSFGTLNDLDQRAKALGSLLGEVDVELDQRHLRMASQPAITPARGLLTSHYGLRVDPITGQNAFHHGIDISARPGQEVVASADGIVVRAERVGSLGRAIHVSHRFGTATRYGHLSKILVEPGQKVRRGDVIGLVGNSGRTTGYHLHYEVRVDGDSQDPRKFMLDR